MRQRKVDAGQASAAPAAVGKAASAASPAAASSPAAAPAARGWWVPDAVILAVLAVLAAVSRFWRIHDPRGIIFDEVRTRRADALPPLPPPRKKTAPRSRRLRSRRLRRRRCRHSRAPPRPPPPCRAGAL